MTLPFPSQSLAAKAPTASRRCPSNSPSPRRIPKWGLRDPGQWPELRRASADRSPVGFFCAKSPGDDDDLDHDRGPLLLRADRSHRRRIGRRMPGARTAPAATGPAAGPRKERSGPGEGAAPTPPVHHSRCTTAAWRRRLPRRTLTRRRTRSRSASTARLLAGPDLDPGRSRTAGRQPGGLAASAARGRAGPADRYLPGLPAGRPGSAAAGSATGRAGRERPHSGRRPGTDRRPGPRVAPGEAAQAKPLSSDSTWRWVPAAPDPPGPDGRADSRAGRPPRTWPRESGPARTPAGAAVPGPAHPPGRQGRGAEASRAAAGFFVCNADEAHSIHLHDATI